jgi:hypothetical protein
MDESDDKIVQMAEQQALLRDHFLGWQSRIRQLAMREQGGRPTDGMRPLVTLPGQEEPLGQIITVLVKREPQEITAQMQHIVRRTQDPLQRLEDGMKVLQAGYYQQARGFSDRPTALFAPESEAARLLVHHAACRLDFQQFSQSYRLPCKVLQLDPRDQAWQATYWHNAIFNPNLPPGVKVLEFQPDWAHALAEPSPAQQH